jgi:hypothetical protein
VLLFNTAHPKAVRSKTPFTLVMVDCATKIIRGQQNVWDKVRVLIARRTGIHFLLRRSEFLDEDGKTNAGFRIFILGRVFHSIRRMDTLFFTKMWDLSGWRPAFISTYASQRLIKTVREIISEKYRSGRFQGRTGASAIEAPTDLGG